jgi:hypothetical protein
MDDGIRLPHTEEDDDFEIILQNKDPRVRMAPYKQLAYRCYSLIKEEEL